MLLTEEAMAEFRAASAGNQRYRAFPFTRHRGLALPEAAYSDPIEVFGEGWAPAAETNSYDDVRRALKIGAVLAFTGYFPALRLDRPWWAIRHQCGGHSCNQLEMIGTPLSLRSVIVEPLLEIARDGYHAEQGRFDSYNLLGSRVARYVNNLQTIGLDCEASWRYLTESVYPIDATQENLNALSEDAPDLRSVVDWGGSLPARYSDDPVILILAENSD